MNIIEFIVNLDRKERTLLGNSLKDYRNVSRWVIRGFNSKYKNELLQLIDIFETLEQNFGYSIEDLSDYFNNLFPFSENPYESVNMSKVDYKDFIDGIERSLDDIYNSVSEIQNLEDINDFDDREITRAIDDIKKTLKENI